MPWPSKCSTRPLFLVRHVLHPVGFGHKWDLASFSVLLVPFLVHFFWFVIPPRPGKEEWDLNSRSAVHRRSGLDGGPCLLLLPHLSWPDMKTWVACVGWVPCCAPTSVHTPNHGSVQSVQCTARHGCVWASCARVPIACSDASLFPTEWKELVVAMQAFSS